MSEADGAAKWQLWIDRDGGYGSPWARRQAADQAADQA